MAQASEKRPAGRPRSVPREQALQKAKDLFWSLGYQRASLDELERATGLKRGSLYALFGDKRALFLETLTLYGDEAIALMDSTMPRGAKRSDIAAWAKLHSVRAYGAAGIRGCFLIETVVEMGPHEPEIAECANAIFRAMLKRLERAFADGDGLEVVDAVGRARALLAGLEGLRVLGKVGQTEKDVGRCVDTLLALLVPEGAGSLKK